MSAFAGDTSVESLPFSAVVERGRDRYLFEVALLRGGAYAAGFSDLIASTRFGWHADLGVLLDFATHFNPPNFRREEDLPGRLGEVFARHRKLDSEAERDREAGVTRLVSHAYLLGHGNGHVTVALLRHGWDSFSLRAFSGLRDGMDVATSRHAEPLLLAMEPIVRATDREATRLALAGVPGIVQRWRDANLGNGHTRSEVA